MPITDSRPDEPDFMCIGLQKAATGWLYDQFRAHSGFWMPPMKELHYFDRPYPNLNNATRLLRLRRAAERRGDVDGRDATFFAAAFAAFTEPNTRRGYAAMFAAKGSLASGDVTPGYSTLSSRVVARLAEWFPQTKIVLILRDPVERFWSAACMLWRRGELDAAVMADIDQLRSLLELPRVRKRSFPTKIAARWRDAFGESRFRTFFFDDIAKEPERTRGDIVAFIGAAGAPVVDAGIDRKASQTKVEMPPAIRAGLAQTFRAELEQCRATFGGHAAAWCEKYGF